MINQRFTQRKRSARARTDVAVVTPTRRSIRTNATLPSDRRPAAYSRQRQPAASQRDSAAAERAQADLKQTIDEQAVPPGSQRCGNGELAAEVCLGLNRSLPAKVGIQEAAQTPPSQRAGKSVAGIRRLSAINLGWSIAPPNKLPLFRPKRPMDSTEQNDPCCAGSDTSRPSLPFSAICIVYS
ncbi:MAG: hypothetical protein M5R42_16525 [Rhodocyclaceae bacterium]|nr:hypothetical protein [Rhodocyclaceae bacterium]